MNVMRFRAYLIDPARPLDVDGATPVDLTVMPADRMRAERASSTVIPPSQRGADKLAAHAETWVLLYLWCAARRLGAITDEPFERFADRVAEYDRLTAAGEVVDPSAEDVDPATVDPTPAAAVTGSPLPSPPGSDLSSSGSTPTPTPA